MQAIQPPIKPRESGPHVANSQDALLALLERDVIRPATDPDRPTAEELKRLTEGLKEERRESQFGDATLQLVVYFQAQQRLGDSLRGVVEETTAARLNEWLERLRLLDGVDTQDFTIRGTVLTAERRPVSGAAVRAFVSGLRTPQQFDEAITDAQGAYIIRYDAKRFDVDDRRAAITPFLIVRAFVGDDQIGEDVTRKRPERDEVIDFEVAAPVRSEWEALSGAVLPLLKDQGLNGVALPPWELNDRDLDVIAKQGGLEREHVRLWALAFAEGRDAAVEMVTGRGSDLSNAAIFFAWFRQGLPPERSALWAIPTDRLIAALHTAVNERLVPSASAAVLDGMKARIEQIKLDLRIKAPQPGSIATLGDLLATLPTPLDVDQQRALARVVTDLRPDDPKLVDRIADLPGFKSNGHAVEVARTLRLGALTRGNVPLAHALQRRTQLGDEAEATLRPLTTMRSDEWLDLAYTHGTPNGSTPVAYANVLVADIERQYPTEALAAQLTKGRRLAKQPMLANVAEFLRVHPTFDIATANLNLLTQPSEPGGAVPPEPLVAGLRTLQRMHALTGSWDETATLLENDLYSPQQLLAAGPGQLAVLLDGQLAPERVAALYRDAEYLHNTTVAAVTAALSPLSAPPIFPGLFGNGITGREIDPDDFGGGGRPEIEPQPFPDDDGTGGSLGLTTLEELLASRGGAFDPKKAITLREPPPLKKRPVGDDEPQLNLGGVVDHQPTLRALFGDQDACACGHCNSVLSPAAYFVDVLQFIKNAGALDALLQRRPDLQDVELSCDNTNTPVPAIDLALEILENAVAFELKADLDAGTDVEAELARNPVGAAVQRGLKKTVRNLAGDVRATREGDAWTVVDGHRRWKLTAQREDALKAGAQVLATAGLNLSALIAALDDKRVMAGSEAAFARLFAGNQTEWPGFANYEVTITPLEPGKSWRVAYRLKGQVVTIIDGGIVELQTPAGEVMWKQPYGKATIAAITTDLSSRTVPVLVHGVLASRLPRAPEFTAMPAAANTWTLASATRELTLRFAPAQLTVTSLAYQSGDPRADAIAWPENHNPAAYARLNAAVFPWSLPLDLPLEEVRLFLDRAGISRRRLIELLQPVDQRAAVLVHDVPEPALMREDTLVVFSARNRNAITVDERVGDRLVTTVSATKGTVTAVAFAGADIRGSGTDTVIIRGTAGAINGALDGLLFTPIADYNGPVSLTTTTTGVFGTHVDTLALKIAPVVDIADDTAVTEESTAITIPVLANDSFENVGRSITAIDGRAIVAGGPAVAVAHGAVTLNAAGQLTFAPTPKYSGQASFTYTVTSGGVTETATVQVTVKSAAPTSFTLEILGLNAAQASLICAPATAPAVYSYWGIDSSRSMAVKDPQATHGYRLVGVSQLDQLKNVSILLQQSRLDYQELQALLETRFVAGQTAPLRIQPTTTCKPSEMTLPGLTGEYLDRLHRLTRLWRALGWTLRELDLAIDACGGTLRQDTLVTLVRFQQLKQQLELPLDVLVGGLHRLESRPWIDHLAEGAPVRPSLYEAIFQREDPHPDGDVAAFALRADGSQLETTPIGGIGERAGYIGACLGVKPAIVKGWVSETNGLGIRDRLNLENLSKLAVAAGLCRALGIDFEKLTHHLQLYGASASPFQSGASPHERAGAMLDFIERFRPMEKSGIDVETVRYLLQHYEAPDSTALDEYQLKQLVDAARDAVRSIPAAEETLPPLDPLAAASAADEAERAASAIQASREDAVIAALAAGFGAERDLVDDVLHFRLRQSAAARTAPAIAVFLDVSFLDSDATSAPVYDVLVRLHKTLFLCDALKLSRADLRLLKTSAGDRHGFTALDFNVLPVSPGAMPAVFAGFEQLLALTQLRRLSQGAGNLLHNYAGIDFGVAGTVDAAQEMLAGGLGLEKPEVTAAAAHLGITSEQYREPVALTRLTELLIALKSLGATVQEALDLTAPSPQDAGAMSARELLRIKHGDAQWHELIKPIADELRPRQRDALVDYLVARDQKSYGVTVGPPLIGADPQSGADDLYERYLIDVRTGSCLKTTRLLYATAAAQLFVQRLLLNVEPGYSLTPDKRALWDWMRSYRVWEANRKVFLFPENWLLPELRDDKTEIFRQMEGALTEQEPSPETTRGALLGYLEELGDLAQISVIAMYQDQRMTKDDQGRAVVKHMLYVIGRTPDTPKYFWRSCTEFGTPQMAWSGWEALELDNANDYLMPFVFDGNLHIAWPIFRKSKEENKDQQDTAKLLWEVQLGWTRRTNKGWVKRKIGKAQLANVERLPNKEESDSFAFRFRKELIPVPGGDSLTGESAKREKITIDCYAARELDGRTPSLEPDPTPFLNKGPTGDALSINNRPDSQWNVSLVVEGVVFKHYKVGAEQQQVNRPYGDVTVELWDAQRQDTGGTNWNISLMPVYVTTTDPVSGAFRFSFPTTQTGRNGGEGLLNGGPLKLMFFADGKTLHDTGIVKLVKEIPGAPSEYSYSWTWRLSVGVEDKTIEDDFKKNRTVNRVKAGVFVLETGRDLSATPLADLTPYVDDAAGFAATNNSLPASKRRSAPLSVVRATQSLGGEPDIWSIKESDDSFSYLQLAGSTWRRWPDRQPFVSIYRLDAATSNSTLFRPDNQKRLHLDPAANTFDRQMAYANYNWELFLHAPLAIADYLASQQRFEDARRWLHAVFDPTTADKDKGVPRFWRFLEFHNDSQPASIARMLTWLADPDTTDVKVPDFEKKFAAQIAEWQENPFMPHLVARLRPSAYQWHTFFAYLDLLIGWGDQLFRRDTRESVNEATLLYVLAAKLLGPRPRLIPAPSPPPAQTYRSLLKDAKGDLDGFGNAWILYSELPGVKRLASRAAYRASESQTALAARNGNGTSISIEKPPGKTPAQVLTSLSALAFCIPQNDRIAEFHDRVADRLFNVRNCRNIDGVFRDLPLYEPPIDPLLLIRARAAGLTIESALGEQYAPLPNYRFTFTLQKALELCAELKSLGGALLGALEKADAEELSLLRSRHEIALLELVRETRQQQIAEAEANIEGLQQSEATILERFGHYQTLLGKPGITKGQDGLPVVEHSSSLSVATDPVGGASGWGLTRMEVAQLVLTAVAHTHTQAASSGHVVAGIVSLLPNIWAGGIFAGQTFGGLNLGSATTAVAKSIEMVAAEANYIANQMGTFAGYERRQDEWVHQSRLALAEMKQIRKQILAAEIRKSIADHELSNHETQIENAKKVDEFMRDKFTSQQLYRWMSSQIAQVYFRTYQLALDQARRAERAFQHELDVDSKAKPFVQSGQWDSLKRGLLAGERLHHDLKRMEGAYLDRNTREFEITKHVSMVQLDPLALIALQHTGTCNVSLPEWLFDLDYPGHYLRRIKSVGITIPCVVGPYASISCTLTLTKSAIRHQRIPGASYPGKPHDTNDASFKRITVPTQSIVTSNAQNDSGLFETSLRDERYLPFEGAGAISEWKLELAKDFPAFDLATIADVILHIRYTARDGGGALKTAATAALKKALKLVTASGQGPLVRVFSLRHEFPSEWQHFLNQPAGAPEVSTVTLPLGKNRFPYLFQASTLAFTSFEILVNVRAEFADTHSADTIKASLKGGTGSANTFPDLTPWGAAGDRLLKGEMQVQPAGTPGLWSLAAWLQTGTSKSRLDPEAIEDALLVCRYTCT
ncbi:MAG TPA: neuraminidase-like domain-containing protein [Vicinamibacterales bacterium]|nr:neuraminidase-like domain-containing protein [Vicinamibacterales bacterium]